MTSLARYFAEQGIEDPETAERDCLDWFAAVLALPPASDPAKVEDHGPTAQVREARAA